MNYFLSGGAKNGKSSLAQDIVCAQPGPHYYLATMIPHDDEDLLRIRRHLENRAGMGFETVECGTDILSALPKMDPAGAVLLDADSGHYDAWTECYRRGLARLDRALAAACENAAELCCAQALWYKGGFER